VESFSVATGDAAVLTVRKEFRRKAAEYNLKKELTKTKQRCSWQSTKITPIFGIAGHKYPVIFHGFFAGFKFFNCFAGCGGIPSYDERSVVWETLV
jgi:hypothetical protein